MRLITGLLLLFLTQTNASEKPFIQAVSYSEELGPQIEYPTLATPVQQPSHLAEQGPTLSNQSSPFCVQLRNVQDYSLRNALLRQSQLDPDDFVVISRPDGLVDLVRKACVRGYEPQFNLHMVYDQPATTWLHRQLSTGFESDVNHFASRFKDQFSERVFHCVANYQYPGFREYVKKLPGFASFIASIGPQLKEGSELYQQMAKLPDGLNNFAILKNIHQQQIHGQNEQTRIQRQQDIREALRRKDFDEQGIKLLEYHDIADQFLYTGNSSQAAQLKQITGFMNDVGDFRQLYHATPELSEISDSATSFGVLANNANRENLPGTSQAFLEIGQNILALGRGLVAGCERNVSGIYHMVRHPIDTFVDISTLIANIGMGIGNVATLIPRLDIGVMLNNQAIIQSVQQDANHYCDGAKQVYQYIDKNWQEKPKLERYELAGNLMTDLLLAKGLPVLAKLGPIKNLAQYKPIAFAKLGNIGREINQIAGLTCAKGAKTVQRGFEAIKNYPQIIQGQQLLGEAVYYSNKCLKASNSYLKKLGKHAAKCAMDVERRLVRIGEQFKKLPKACASKTKQLIGEEIIVTDTLGNVWRSKIGESGWATELSEQGQRATALLNEAAGGLKGAAKEAFQHYRTVPYGIEARETLNVMKWQFEALERELQILGTKFKDFYGAAIEGKLGNDRIHFKGKAHLLSATIKRSLKASGISEKITGLHWDFGRKLEQLGAYSLSDVEHLAGGMYKATLNYGGVIKKGKTFFPSHWDAKMLASKISEACHNMVSMETNWKGALEIIGEVSEGFRISIKLDKKGKILTAYPFIV